jgi:hypothetical protein
VSISIFGITGDGRIRASAKLSKKKSYNHISKKKQKLRSIKIDDKGNNSFRSFAHQKKNKKARILCCTAALLYWLPKRVTKWPEIGRLTQKRPSESFRSHKNLRPNFGRIL